MICEGYMRSWLQVNLVGSLGCQPRHVYIYPQTHHASREEVTSMLHRAVECGAFVTCNVQMRGGVISSNLQ